MAGWYKLDETDALNLAEIQNSFDDRRSRLKRLRMLNYVWSKINSSGHPCPYFVVGRRAMAERCGVSEGTAKRFIEYLEENGWVVRVGEGHAGRAPRRTFWWIADAAKLSTNAPEFSTSGYKVVPATGSKREQVCTRPGYKTPPVCTRYRVQNPPISDHVQSTEYSERAVDTVHSALAEDVPLYSGAGEGACGDGEPPATHAEEALAWYRENGYPDPPEVPPPPGGEL